MPINNSKEPVKRLVTKKFDKPADNFELVNNLKCIKVSLLSNPTLDQLASFIPDYVLATWSDYPDEFTKDLTTRERYKIVSDTFHGKFLPTALETVGLTFRVDGLSYIDITHLLRHRTGSFSAQCTADRFLQSDTHCIPSSIENSKYYEGDKYTYSFRLQKNISERIALVGGAKNFEKLLDEFFGFGKESVTQVREIEAFEEIDSKNYHRFEGFNNECDMETPYAYIYAGNHDKLCEIINDCVNKSFGVGEGGLPGNNDSGGLSSCFVFNAMGFFPVTASSEFLLGAPSFKKVTIKLFNGNLVTITKTGDVNGYLVKGVKWQGKAVENYQIPVSEIVKGGNLEFVMK
jgi:hypothetical protein